MSLTKTDYNPLQNCLYINLEIFWEIELKCLLYVNSLQEKNLNFWHKRRHILKVTTTKFRMDVAHLYQGYAKTGLLFVKHVIIGYILFVAEIQEIEWINTQFAFNDNVPHWPSQLSLDVVYQVRRCFYCLRLLLTRYSNLETEDKTNVNWCANKSRNHMMIVNVADVDAYHTPYAIKCKIIKKYGNFEMTNNKILTEEICKISNRLNDWVIYRKYF